MAHHSRSGLYRVLLTLGAAASAISLATAAHAQAAALVNSETQREAGFDDGRLTPFAVEGVTTNGNYVRPATKDGEPAVETYWAQANYEGTRATRGAEGFAPGFDQYSDGWFAFRFLLPASYPTNKEAAIAQVFQRGCNSWMLILRVVNNQLIMRRRSNNGCGAYTDHLVSDNIARDRWNSLIIRWKVSRTNQGELKVWYAKKAKPSVNEIGINLGGGTFSGDTLDPNVSRNGIPSRFGQYAYDSPNYTPGEERVVYYDDISILKGNPANAYSLVRPF